jgi:hypothetical protein
VRPTGHELAFLPRREGCGEAAGHWTGPVTGGGHSHARPVAHQGVRSEKGKSSDRELREEASIPAQANNCAE